jgi:hypothetical protein
VSAMTKFGKADIREECNWGGQDGGEGENVSICLFSLIYILGFMKAITRLCCNPAILQSCSPAEMQSYNIMQACKHDSATYDWGERVDPLYLLIGKGKGRLWYRKSGRRLG